MNLVPREVVIGWYEEWRALPEPKELPALYTANRAAEWALEQAAKECEALEYFRAAEVIRDLMKGGKSDGQG